MTEFPEEKDRRNGETPRREDLVARSRLQAIQEGYDHWAKRTLAILYIIAALILLGGGVTAYLYALIKDNQQSFCVATNTRHADAAIKLDELVDRAVANGQIPPDQSRARKASNKIILDAILPVREC